MADNGTNPYFPIALLNAVAVTGNGAAFVCTWARRVIEAKVTGSGAVSATVEIYGSATEPTDHTDMVLLATITLAGTDKDVDGASFDAPWPWMLARCTAISAASALTVKLAG